MNEGARDRPAAAGGGETSHGKGEFSAVAHRLQPLVDHRRCAVCGSPAIAAAPDSSRPVLRTLFGVRQDGGSELTCPRYLERAP